MSISLIKCAAAGAGIQITPETAREQYHSFGGVFPPEIVRAEEDFAEDERAYAPENYIHPENIATCECCGHGCMKSLDIS